MYSECLKAMFTSKITDTTGIWDIAITWINYSEFWDYEQ